MSAWIYFSLFLFQAPAQPPAVELAVPFEILASKHMAVQVMVNGKGPYRMIFDTGAPICLLSQRIARETELNKGASNRRAGRGLQPGAFPMLGMGGLQKVDELRIGEAQVEKLPVMVFDHPTVKALASIVGDLDGLIGYPFFARFRTTIDYQQKKLFLTPVDYEPGDVMAGLMKVMSAPRDKAPAKHLAARTVWGFDIAKENGDETAGVTVTKVMAGGPAAAAGLQAGDRLLILDGTWTESREDCWRAAAAVPPGRTVEAKIRRGAVETRLLIRPQLGL
jgi:hypothetical protein